MTLKTSWLELTVRTTPIRLYIDWWRWVMAAVTTWGYCAFLMPPSLPWLLNRYLAR